MAKNPFDQFDSSASAGNPFDQFDSPADTKVPERTFADIAGDIGVTALKGAVGLPESFVGLADIPTGGRVGKALEEIGYRPAEAKQTLDALYSPAQRAANQKLQQADGFVDTIKTAVQNPSTIAIAAGESLPSMLGGAGIARNLLKATPKIAPVLAGAIGEGAIGAGQAAEQSRGESKDGLLSLKQSGAALASGVGTGILGFAGGKLAQRLGIADIDTVLASGAGQASAKGFARQVVESGISEGVFEELPQSVQEQMWQNFAGDKPISEGVGNQAAMGMLTGVAMGGAGGGYNAALGMKPEAKASAPTSSEPSQEPRPSAFNEAQAAAVTGFADDRLAILEAKAKGTEDHAVDGPDGKKIIIPGEQPQFLTLEEKAERDFLLANIQNHDALAYAYGVDPKELPASPGQEAGQAPAPAEDAQTHPASAEQALHTLKYLTALDRVAEIDKALPAASAEEAPALTAERDKITATWPKAIAGGQTSFSTEAGARLDATYALMESGDLTTSHDENLRPSPNYPPELQPRERERAASEMQVSGIVQKLDPARLGLSADAATGAPIVGADGLVESGNARTIALKRVYQANGQKAADYRQFIKDNAAQLGITPESVDAMARPVLVRVRSTPVNRAEFARQANASAVAQMSPSETANADAARMDVLDDLRPDANGDFSTSRDFIRRFMAKLPGTEQAGMLDAGGQLSQGGYTRIRNAVLAKAYGNSPVLARMVESMDDNLRNVGKALVAAAPAVAKVRQAVAEGALFDTDITPDLMAAVEELSRIKESGQSIDEALAQAGMFGDRYSTETRELIQFLADNMRRPRAIAEFIQSYMEALTAYGNPNQGSIFGDTVAPNKGGLINVAKGKENGRTDKNASGRQPAGTESAGAQGGERSTNAQGDRGGDQGNEAASEALGPEWKLFPKDSGTLGIPRANMPQVAIRLRPAMLAFMGSQGISFERADVEPGDLKPTQAEYSTAKTERSKELADDRTDASAVLVSSDGYVLDGHHRWIAKAQEGQPVNVIRFDAPIDRLLDVVREFSGTTASNESGVLLAKRTQAVERFYDAAGDLAQILSKHTRAAIVPEKTPDLMPTLIKLFDAAFDVVGNDAKRATAWVKQRLRAMPEFRTVWNKILPETYRKAALQAFEQYDPNKPANGQSNLFGDAKEKTAQADLFPQPSKGADAKLNETMGVPATWKLAANGREWTDEHGFVRGFEMSGDERAAEQAFYDRIRTDTPGLIKLYLEKMLKPKDGKLVDPDRVKQLSAHYVADESLAHAVHEPSSHLSKIIFETLFKENIEKPVVFTAGGGGSGKTEAMLIAQRVGGISPEGVVFDSTLSSFVSARKKIDQVLAAGGKAVVVYTNCPLEKAFKFSMGRPRVVKAVTLAHAHQGASNAIRDLSEHYKDNPDVRIIVVNNFAGKEDFHAGSIDQVPVYDYNESERTLYELATQARDAGTLPEGRYEAIVKGLSPAARDLPVREAGSVRNPDDAGSDGAVHRSARGNPPEDRGAESDLSDPEAAPKTATQIIHEVAKSRPFDAVADVRSEAEKQVRELTGKGFHEHAELQSSMMLDDVIEAIHAGQYEGARAYAKTLPVHISDSAIPLSEASRAFNGTSFSPERRGRSAQRGLFLELLTLWRRLERQYNAAAPDRQALFVDAFDDMAGRYVGLTRAYLASHGNVVSSMIAGPSNFPAARQRKRSDAADRKAQDANDFIAKAPARLLKVLRGALDNSVQSAIAEAESKLAAREAAQSRMKAVNLAHGKFVKDPESLEKSDLPDADKKLIREYKPRYSWEPHPFAPYELTNNNAELKRLRDRVGELKRRAEDAAATESEPEAIDESAPVRMVKNAELGRVQLLFKEKPGEAVRNALKSKGFKWAPSAQAWQRQLTSNAIAAAEKIVAEHYPDSGADSPPSALSRGAGGGISVRDLKTVRDRVAARMDNMPAVNVLEDPSHAPEALRDHIEKVGAWDDVEGAMHEGEIYLFASGIKDEERAEFVLAQHEITHHGLRGKNGMGLDAVLQHIWMSNKKVRKAATALREKNGLSSNLDAVEEVLADMPNDQLAKLTGWRRLVGTVRDWFAKHGFDHLAAKLDAWAKAGMSEQQKADFFAADLVRQARQWVESGRRNGMSAVTPVASGAMFSRGAAAALGSAALSPMQSVKTKIGDLLSDEARDTIIYNFQNKVIDLKRVQDRINQLGAVIPEVSNAYQAEEVYLARLAKREKAFNEKEVKPLLEAIHASGLSTDTLEQFLHARHAPERNAEMAKRNPNQKTIDAEQARIKTELKVIDAKIAAATTAGTATKALENAKAKIAHEWQTWSGVQAFKGTEDERNALSGMSDTAAATYLSSLDPKSRASLDSLAARINRLQAKTQQTLVDYGLETLATINEQRKQYAHYVPLHRDDAHPQGFGNGSGQGFSVKGSASKKATGSNAEVTDILAHIIMQREQALTRGEKNRVALRMYLLVKSYPDKDFWTTDSGARRVLNKHGFVETVVDPMHASRDNVLMLRVGGKDVSITFNDHNPQAVRLAAALKNLDGADLGLVESAIAKGTRWFASVNTQYNPVFGIINLMRDSQDALLNLSTTEIADRKLQVLKGIPQALAAIYQIERGGQASPKWSAAFEEFQMAGGETGYRDMFATAGDRAKSLLKELKSIDRGNVAKAAHAVADWLSDYNTAMENSTRLSAYVAARDKGFSPEKSASIAKNLTVNFNRKGAKTSQIGAYYAFFNAAIQGSTRMAQTLTGPAGKKIMAGGVALGVLSTLIGMMAMGDDEWEKIPEFVRERSIIIPIGGTKYLSVPMPLGFLIFPNIGRKAVEMMRSNTKSKGRHLGDLAGIIAGALSPISGGDAAQVLTPTVFDPMLALATNKDWTGRKIYREDMNAQRPTPGFTRTKDTASVFSKVFAEQINRITGGDTDTQGVWSPTPDQIDYVIGQLTGGMGREALKAQQAVASTISGEELPAYKIPLAGRLYGNTEGASGNSGMFYENIKRLNELSQQVKGRSERGEDVDQILDSKEGQLIGHRKEAEAVQKLGSLKRTLKKEGASKDEIKDVDLQIAEVMKGVNQSMSEARR